jgi:3',5'-cyclic AMP phosphodiesterase CpdA
VKTIAHISDLHFGREDPTLAEALLEDLAQVGPAVVAVSGDLTQRAKASEFEAAAAWLRRLPAPAVIVPGNHDVPLYDVWARFTGGLSLFRRFIEKEPYPLYADPELAVVGISTARSLTFSGGRISRPQMAAIEARLAPIPAPVFRVLVTHHHFVPSPRGRRQPPIERAERALHAIEACGIELLLAGHVHLGYAGDVRHYYSAVRRSILFVQAGTAISNRRRGEPNAWTRITVSADEVQVEARVWEGRRFAPHPPSVFRREDGAWVPVQD